MPDTTCHMSISLDGFVAGPDQSREDPLGKRGRELHGWHIGDARERGRQDRERVAHAPAGCICDGSEHVRPDSRGLDEEWTGWLATHIRYRRVS